VAGGGALTDLGIHFLDLVRYLLGDCEWLQCQTRTFIKSRPKPANTQLYEEVLVDDWALCTMQLKNGGIGSLEVSRVAGGAGDMTAIEILWQPRFLKNRLQPAERIKRLWDASKNQWIVCGTLPDGIPTGFLRSNHLACRQTITGAFMMRIVPRSSFLNCLENNAPLTADFETAFRSQQLLHTAYRSAAEGEEKSCFRNDAFYD
jgi:predicted dehydrogenase